MSKKITVSIKREILEAIFEGARHLYPRETILMLRGKKSKDIIQINDLIIPPLATYGEGFASYPFHLLPMDFSLVGTVHSHPSGDKTPSDVDLNNFFGRVMMIVGFPYMTDQDVVAYNWSGEELPILIVE
ncbi:MAG: Mov34/MPN/PAD-1 family protein [Candidatus Bathyarchaeota archaeon]|jgi:proteasome lid subunit RPN8/RPN11|nr:Mov34/MPN/PAD-1 family protein [Candidatus Bathyarchaeota archaeon]MDI9578858.1 Mov34/MPN/PAD-1 family protein [Thermoproteota archaeon]